MHLLEQVARRLRHSTALGRSEWLWDRARPIYNAALLLVSGGQLRRNINGTDSILIKPSHRSVPELYEPAVWAQLMEHVRPDDVVADAGAFIGLYSIALAKRVGSQGRVLAFEPAPENFASLSAHVRMNGVEDRVELFQAALGPTNGETSFASNGIESHIGTGANSYWVKLISLDTALRGRRVDILKVDVEGAEEEVLRGASATLGDPTRRPRVMFIEVHPYAWAGSGTTSESLTGLLAGYGYQLRHLDGTPVVAIDSYGEVVAFSSAARVTGSSPIGSNTGDQGR